MVSYPQLNSTFYYSSETGKKWKGGAANASGEWRAIYVYYINIESDSSGSHFDSYLGVECLYEQENLLTYSGHRLVMAFLIKYLQISQ